MSILFSSRKIGTAEIKNRFIHSACEDNMATAEGAVTPAIIRKNRILAKNEVGLIIWSHLFVHPAGRTKKYQSGIHSDKMIGGLQQVTDAVHENDGKIAFQLGHAGIQTDEGVIGRKPLSPATMTKAEIREVVSAFKSAAGRAVAAGVDGIQLHGAHGYLINNFLSPYFNTRTDEYGGSDENRFRLFKEIISEIRSMLPAPVFLLAKLNTNDHTRKAGITPELAVKYAMWLAEMAICGIEVSSGTSLGATWQMCRGHVPVEEMTRSFPPHRQDAMRTYFSSQQGKFDLEGPYHLEACKAIKQHVTKPAVFAVGGWRRKNEMETAVLAGETDFIAMCRPFIHQPSLVRLFKENRTGEAACKNCNRCLAALPNDMPVRCYVNRFPQ